MKIYLGIAFLVCITTVRCIDDYTDDVVWMKFLDRVTNDQPSTEDEICSLNYESEFPFTCEIRPSQKEPATVHELTPADVDVIGALGDSLTAGFGADTCTLDGREFRGRSWTIGGDADVNTILTTANLIKAWNPNLIGYSVGLGGPNSEGSNFNVAVGGARAEHMPNQAENLVKRMKEHEGVNLEEDWKVVTIFIGGNDLCQYCNNKNKYSVEQYTYYIQQALDILHDNLPRTFVNVMGVLVVPELGYYSNLRCDAFHYLVCGCAVFLSGDEQAEIEVLMEGYQKQTEALINSGRYDDRDDFAVVYQPFLEKSHMPFKEDGEADGSYFAPDCFHFSSRLHAVGAKDLWTNMLQPVGQKDTSWKPHGPIKCPSSDFPYFYTNKNSLMENGSTTVMSSICVLFVSTLIAVLFA